MLPGSIGVLEAPDKSMPIGIAHCVRWGERGFAIWRLIVNGTELPGEFVIVDREFRPAQESGQAPGRG
jgi:hypothetical protein